MDPGDLLLVQPEPLLARLIMALQFFTGLPHPTQDITVDAAVVEDSDDLVALRKSDWHEGQLRLLTYPTRVYGVIEGGFSFFEAPMAIVKGPGGDLETMPSSVLLAEHVENLPKERVTP